MAAALLAVCSASSSFGRELCAPVSKQAPAARTSNRELDAVRKYLGKQYPKSEAELYAVVGDADKAGRVSCRGEAGTWKFLFFLPKTKSWLVLNSCDGKVKEGGKLGAKISPSEFDPLPERFTNSARAAERGAGGRMLLVQHKPVQTCYWDAKHHAVWYAHYRWESMPEDLCFHWDDACSGAPIHAGCLPLHKLNTPQDHIAKDGMLGGE